MALNLLVIIGIEEETPQYILLFSNDVDIWDSSPVEPTHQPILSKRPHQEFRFQLPCIDPAIQQDPSDLATHQFVEGWNNRLCIQGPENKPHWMHLSKYWVTVDAARISRRIGWKMHENASPSPK